MIKIVSEGDKIVSFVGKCFSCGCEFKTDPEDKYSDINISSDKSKTFLAYCPKEYCGNTVRMEPQFYK